MHRPYAITMKIRAPFDDTVSRVREAFAANGFGVVVELDFQAMLRAKAGVDIGPYLVLGMCNPEMAAYAIQHEPSVGVLLPCNVAIQAHGDAVVISAQDPAMIAEVTGNPALEPVASEVGKSIRAALDAVAVASA